MKVPNKIYLQVCGDCPHEDCEHCNFEDLEDNVTWYKERIFEQDKEYISKDLLLEWLKPTLSKEGRERLNKMFLRGWDEMREILIAKINEL
jgi:hypothetical protein